MTNLENVRTTRQSSLLIVGLVVASMVGFSFSNNALAQSQSRFGGPDSSSSLNRFSFEDVSHASLDALLRRYVDCNGMVCYRQWRDRCSDVRALEVYLHGLSQVDVGIPARREAKMAFYINAYNAMTIWGILREYSIASPSMIRFKGMMSHSDEASQNAAPCDSCDSGVSRDLESFPFAPENFMMDAVPDPL